MIDDKIKLIKKLKPNYLILLDFEKIKNIQPTEFLRMLKHLGVKRFVCGNDFKFGYNRLGGIEDLLKFFEVKIISDITHNGERISTTSIREHLKKGDVSNANIMLNRNYSINGIVVEGTKIGRTLGIRTANIKPDQTFIPANGVYITKTKVGLITYKSVTNIGHNPTLNKQTIRRVETHILNFNKEIYNKNIKISFVKYLRAEQTFNTKEELQVQLGQDIENAKYT